MVDCETDYDEMVDCETDYDEMRWQIVRQKIDDEMVDGEMRYMIIPSHLRGESEEFLICDGCSKSLRFYHAQR